MTRLATAAIALGSLLAASQPAVAQDLGAALARADHWYHGHHTFRIAFRQTITNPMLGAPETSRGTMFVQPPDRFAMRFRKPAGDRIVADGKWLWAYTPSTVPNQVIRQPVPTAGATTPNLFGQFVDHPRDRYRAALAGTDSIGGTVVDLVRLVPRADDAPFREAVIAIARIDGSLRRIALVEPSGQRRVLVFEEIATDVAIARSEFRFVPPRGTRVVTP